ncbi:MAG TPA: metallophosphoesterase family protein [Verrucomicrobiae bacterium]|nr:metallophosphoesterase family protein [Verrucomicrobiae bacterium]
MRLLLFSDIHTDTTAAARLVELARGVDVVIGAGDFGSMRQKVGACMPVLAKIKVPAVLVAGNNESYDELVAACKSWPQAHILQGAGIKIEGVSFFGLGGGVPITPFGSWSWDFSEADAEHLLRDCPNHAVLISHSPPKGFVDRASSGQSLGSTAVYDAVIRTQPRLVVCGHIHACAGQRAVIEKTPVINAGPQGVLFDMS